MFCIFLRYSLVVVVLHTKNIQRPHCTKPKDQQSCISVLTVNMSDIIPFTFAANERLNYVRVGPDDVYVERFEWMTLWPRVIAFAGSI